jgi:2-iminoacetate synthase
MSFRQTYDTFNWYDIHSRILEQTEEDVKRVLQKSEPRDHYDFLSLISPAAEKFLPEMMAQSRELTQKRFGKRIRIYAPLYLSNYCYNNCVYCGFRYENTLERVRLTDQQIMKEITVLNSMGIDHLLLVTGESNKMAGVDYLRHALQLLRPYFVNLSVEVQPLREEEYRILEQEGLGRVYVYQETYHRDHYRDYHPKGMKSHFYYRLETPDRIARAGIDRIGLGILIGLEDWRTDAFFTAMHAAYLNETYGTTCSISFPRLRPAVGIMPPRVTITEEQLMQMICAYRLFSGDLELSLSTRESAAFRDKALFNGITSMSAGSKTNPGGYATYHEESLEQFEIADHRSVEEFCAMLHKNGYEPVWSDESVAPIEMRKP